MADRVEQVALWIGKAGVSVVSALLVIFSPLLFAISPLSIPYQALRRLISVELGSATILFDIYAVSFFCAVVLASAATEARRPLFSSGEFEYLKELKGIAQAFVIPGLLPALFVLLGVTLPFWLLWGHPKVEAPYPLRHIASALVFWLVLLIVVPYWIWILALSWSS